MLDSRQVVLSLVASTIFPLPADASSAPNAQIKLNVAALEFARELIAHGQFVADKKGAWISAHPTRSEENDFARHRGFLEYSKWYLGVDERHAINSKSRYKFPFGDFQNVHRSGLLAVKARAHEYDYQEIEKAAAQLLEMIESRSPARQKRVD